MIGSPDSAISRTASCPAYTATVVALMSALRCNWIMVRDWAGSANATTVPVAPARAVRPERCR